MLTELITKNPKDKLISLSLGLGAASAAMILVILSGIEQFPTIVVDRWVFGNKIPVIYLHLTNLVIYLTFSYTVESNRALLAIIPFELFHIVENIADMYMFMPNYQLILEEIAIVLLHSIFLSLTLYYLINPSIE